MKEFFILSAIAVSTFSFAQKVKIKKDIAFVDGKQYVKITEDAASRHSYNISSNTGKDLFYLKMNSYKDPKEVDYKYNPSGSVAYFEVMSSDLNTVYFETSLSQCLMGCNIADNTIKMLYSSNIINSDESINFDKLEMLSKKVGFPYSQKRGEMNGNSGNTVIIQDSAPKSGVNIHIGR